MPPITGQTFFVTMGASANVLTSQISTTPANWNQITGESNPTAVPISGIFADTLTVQGAGAVGQSSVISYSLVNGETGSFTVQIVAAAPATPNYTTTIKFAGDPLVITPAEAGLPAGVTFVNHIFESQPETTFVLGYFPELTMVALTESGSNDTTFVLSDGSQFIIRVDIVDTTVDFMRFLAGTGTRVLLVELDYDGGTEYISNIPWLSDTGIPYNDFLIDQPTISASLRDFLSIGDIQAINPLNGFFADHWLSRDWRGHECRLYLGGEDWARADFRLIASTRIDSCQIIDGGDTFRFKLRDPASQYQQRWLNSAKTYSNTVPNVLNQVLSEAGFNPPHYIGIDFATEGQWQCTVAADETTDLLATLRRLASSMGAYVRADLGFLQIIRPDRGDFGSATTSYTLDESDIVVDGFRGVGEQPANTSVNVVMHDDTVITISGTGDETRRIDTYLNNTAHAGALASMMSGYYVNRHQKIEIESVTGANFIRVGDNLSHNYSQVNIISSQKGGICERIRLDPLGGSSTITIAHWAFN